MSRHHRAIKWTTITGQVRPIIKAAIDAGDARCIRCGHVIEPGTQWDIGHRVDLAQGGDPRDVGPEHRRCNRRAGGRLGAAMVNDAKRAQRRMPTW